MSRHFKNQESIKSLQAQLAEQEAKVREFKVKISNLSARVERTAEQLAGRAVIELAQRDKAPWLADLFALVNKHARSGDTEAVEHLSQLLIGKNSAVSESGEEARTIAVKPETSEGGVLPKTATTTPSDGLRPLSGILTPAGLLRRPPFAGGTGT